MHLSSCVVPALLLALSHAAAAAYYPVGNGSQPVGCVRPKIRREWRSLSTAQKSRYVSAVQCLLEKPSQLSDLYAGSRSRYDDYNGLHIAYTERIHYVGQFFPWHRMFIYLYERELESCGYADGHPYWDWSIDAETEDAWASSPLFDPATGFGGNGEYIEDISNYTWTSVLDLPGRTGGGCVTDGPFANLTVSLGPGNSTGYNPHCLRRDFVPPVAVRTLNQSYSDWVQSADTFWEYSRRAQLLSFSLAGATTHAGGHLAVGGQIGDLADRYASPADPLFYLHHCQLDKRWHEWQQADPTGHRLQDVGGPDTMWGYPFNFTGRPNNPAHYENITLAFPIDFGRLGPALNVSQVMDIAAAVLCYAYQ